MSKASESADEVLEILQSFGVTELDSDVILSMKQGKVIEFAEAVQDLPKITTQNISQIQKITKILREWKRRSTQADFWAALRENSVQSDRLECMSLITLQAGDEFVFDGVSLYLTLLGMEPALSIWNPLLFQPVLSILLSAAQVLEDGGQIKDETEEKLKKANMILPMVQQLISKSFINMIGLDTYIALAEVTTKLASGFRPEYDKYNSNIQSIAFTMLHGMIENQNDVILQFLVPWALLYFAQSTSTMSARLEKLYGKITEFLMKNIKHLSDEDHDTFIKHLMMRAPERSHLKKCAASLVFNLIKISKNPVDLVNFVMKLGLSSRAGNRAFASSIIALCVVKFGELKIEENNDESEDEQQKEEKKSKQEELLTELINVIKKHVVDKSPTVRSAGLDGFSIIIQSVKTHVYKNLIRQQIDSNKYLVDTMKLRLSDEKLVVRKSALNCVQEIVKSMQTDPSEVLVELIVDRVRDFAVSIRNSAIHVMSELLEAFPKNEYVHRQWLDAILPLIEDKEQSVQKEAMEEMNEHLFTPIISGAKEMFTSIMHKEHYNFLSRTFTVLRLSGYDLSPLSRSLTKFVINRENDSNRPYWRMIEILTREKGLKVLFKDKGKLFADIWYRREILPPEYYGALANLNVKSKEIFEDISKDINEAISKGSRYLLSHELLELYNIQNEDSEATALSLIKYCIDEINKVSENEEGKFDDPKAFAQTVFILGELFKHVNDPKRLTDYDLTGVQILLAEKLPNGVEIPTEVRAIAVITVGKLCIKRKDISTNSVFSFAKLLSSETAPEVKANCLIILCDLNVEYSLMVNAHIPVMTNCLSDKNPAVKRQALNVITRLIVEDYIKMDSLFFFRFLHSVTDKNKEVAEFARCCLFNVIFAKYPDILTKYFVDSLMYFSECGQLLTLDEDKESHERFRMPPRRRLAAYRMIINRMSEPSVFKLIQDVFTRVIDKFISGEYKLKDQTDLLQDVLLSLHMMEDKLQNMTKPDTATEETVDKTLEAAKVAINGFHKSLISTLLPKLKSLHQLVRVNNSPLQKHVKKLYQQLCANDSELLNDLERTEPILAAEIREELNKEAEAHEEEEEEAPAKETKFAPLSSPLLIRISNTPISLLCSPAPPSGDQSVLKTPKRAKLVKNYMTPPHNDIEFSD